MWRNKLLLRLDFVWRIFRPDMTGILNTVKWSATTPQKKNKRGFVPGKRETRTVALLGFGVRIFIWQEGTELYTNFSRLIGPPVWFLTWLTGHYWTFMIPNLQGARRLQFRFGYTVGTSSAFSLNLMRVFLLLETMADRIGTLTQTVLMALDFSSATKSWTSGQAKGVEAFVEFDRWRFRRQFINRYTPISFFASLALYQLQLPRFWAN